MLSARQLVHANSFSTGWMQFIAGSYQNSISNYHDHCEPRALSWQWRVKESPDVHRCSKLCLKKKACPKKRFFPRFKKTYVHGDILACETPGEPSMPQTWSEYFSFLLPEEYTQKPPQATCRKMLEHRRRKCMSDSDYSQCIRGECWPLPTEWYGQGVLHVSELALSKSQVKAIGAPKHCPPSTNMISRCIPEQKPVCPLKGLPCLEEKTHKMPYSQFRGAETDSTPFTVTLNCPHKFHSELLPQKHQDKSNKLSCKTHGERTTIECPKQMFYRYMNVDLNSTKLLPKPTTFPSQPLREVKKGVCNRQSLSRQPSFRNFSTGPSLWKEDYPEFIKNPENNQHLQPNRSPLNFDKIAEKAGVSQDLLQKPATDRSFYSYFTDEELSMHEKAAKESEETAEERKKKLESKKSKLQILMEKKKAVDEEAKKFSVTKAAEEDSPLRPFYATLVDLEDVPYRRSKFHTSSHHLARNTTKKENGKSNGPGREQKVCSGCPGIRALDDPKSKSTNRCQRRAKGKCRVTGAHRNPLTLKCKSSLVNPCARKKGEDCQEEYKSDLPCQQGSQNKTKRGFHTASCPDLLSNTTATSNKPECYLTTKNKIASPPLRPIGLLPDENSSDGDF